jgi:hypothetical protein
VTLPKGQKFDVRKGDVVTVQGIMLKEKLVVLSEKDMVIDPKKEVFQKQVDEGAGSAVGMRQLIESGVVEGSRKWWVLGLLVIGGGVGWIMYSRPRSSEVEVPAMAGFTPPLPLPQFTLSSIDNSQTTFYDSPTR